MRQLIILTIILTTTSCNTDTATNYRQSFADTIGIKNWLNKVIVDYRNSERTADSDKRLQSVLTEDYYNYKVTDITSEYDTLSEDQFNERWKTKFQTQYVGKGGFFNWAPDSGPIEVLKCNFVKQIADTSLIFHIVVQDLRWKTTNEMEVSVISRKDTLLIADVKHKD